MNLVVDRVVSSVLERFDALPAKSKPRSQEWVPLSGLCTVRGHAYSGIVGRNS